MKTSRSARGLRLSVRTERAGRLAVRSLQILAGLSFASAVICIFLWFYRGRSILAFSTRSLVHEREPIAQRFPSIESLLLSGFEKPDFKAAPHAKAVLASIFNPIDETLGKPRDLAKIESAGLASKLKLEGSSSLREQDIVNRDSRDRIQIFLPAILLPTDPNGDEPIRDRDQLARIIDRSPQLKVDLAASFALADDLANLKTASFGEWQKPVQAYFVTRTGVVAAPPDTGQRAALRSPTRVYFAERPYFWDSLKHGNDNRTALHITYPYIDLVGKGVLFTICHGVKSSSVSESVVCLDFKVDESILVDRLKPFQVETPVEVKCDFEKEDHDDRIEGELIGCDNRIVTDYVHALNQEKKYDYLTGGVYVPDPTLGFTANSKSSLLYFTIPIGRTEDKQILLLYVIDPDKPKKSLLKYWSIFTLLLLSGCIATGFAMFYSRRERRAERRAIFADIYRKIHHTALGGMFSAKLAITRFKEKLPSEPALAEEAADRILQLLGQAQKDCRRLLKLFVSESKDEFVFNWTTDLASEFEQICTKLEKEYGTPMRITQKGRPYPLTPSVLDDVYAVGCEALENASRHAQSKEVDLALDWTWRRLRLQVCDEGHGFDTQAESAEGHFGLQIMQSVAKHMGAKFDLQSILNVGTTVTLQVPIRWFALSWLRREFEKRKMLIPRMTQRSRIRKETE